MKYIKSALFVLGFFYIQIIFSQQLANTTWQSNIYNLYYQFNATTVSWSIDNINYTPFATYQENGNNFSIQDIQSGSISPCGVTTGNYTFTIFSNNVINFAAVSDYCSTRRNTLVGNWNKVITTGITDQVNQQILNPVFPNPTKGQITIPSSKEETSFSIVDQTGKEVLNGEFRTTEQRIDLSALPKGVYYLRSEDGRIKAQRIIKS